MTSRVLITTRTSCLFKSALKYPANRGSRNNILRRVPL